MKVLSFLSFVQLSLASFYHPGMNPGMMLRIDQTSIDALKRVCERYLPNYFNVDLEIPEQYYYHFDSSVTDSLDWSISWTDIQYSNFDLDMEDVVFELSEAKVMHHSLIKFDFPALRFFEISG